jgi:DNA-binding NarL/FixJ family response regulator
MPDQRLAPRFGTDWSRTQRLRPPGVTSVHFRCAVHNVRVSGGPLRVGVLSRHSKVVAHGLLALLGGRIDVQPVLLRGWDEAAGEVDVVLFDVYSLHGERAGLEAERLCAFTKLTEIPVVAVDRPLRPDLAARALDHGAVSYVSMDDSADELVVAVRQAADRGWESAAHSGGVAARGSSEERLHARFGLTPTEVVTLRLVAAGRSNKDIARECCISLNTVKTRIRLAYGRIGVGARSQAVLWAVEHGLGPD